MDSGDSYQQQINWVSFGGNGFTSVGLVSDSAFSLSFPFERHAMSSSGSFQSRCFDDAVSA